MPEDSYYKDLRVNQGGTEMSGTLVSGGDEYSVHVRRKGKPEKKEERSSSRKCPSGQHWVKGHWQAKPDGRGRMWVKGHCAEDP